MNRFLLAALVIAAACGGSDAPPPPPRGNSPAGASAGAKSKGKVAKRDNKKIAKLEARMHAEDNVACPAPDKATGPECKPDASVCEPGLYGIADALPANAAPGATPKYSCEPCAERDTIRHVFKDRDFIAEQSRDPFQSFVIVPPNLGKPVANNEKITGPCRGLKASSFSYQDLKLVGLVGSGTRKTALMMNSRNIGEFIRRGDCVGKEKALVADIVMHDETACLTFEVQATQGDKGPREPAHDQTVCLYPNGLPAPESQPQIDEPTGPQVAPPPGAPAVPPPGAALVSPPPR